MKTAHRNPMVSLKSLPATLLVIAGITAIAGCDSDGNSGDDSEVRAFVAGAGYASFDVARGGCNNDLGDIDCNVYATSRHVYTSAGPSEDGLADGEYFFVVIAPGQQKEGFLDGAPGNLSDGVATVIDESGATNGDEGSGDGVENRTFTVANHEIVEYQGKHAMGRNSQRKTVLEVGPFDTTDNPGGAYVLGICRVDAISASECEFDAFRIQPPTSVPPVEKGSVQGGKYYDANTNGVRDEGEPGLGNWLIDYSNGEVHRVQTDSDGRFRAELATDAYTFAEVVPLLSPSWRQTGNRDDQTSSSAGNSVTLDWDMSYDAVVVELGESEELWFGNVCIGGGGAHTLGYWGNEKGAIRVTSADLEMLATLNLVDAEGEVFDPADHDDFAAWLREGSVATNMAHALSVQLAVMQLNITYDVEPTALIYAPGNRSANVAGFGQLADLVIEADTALQANPLTLEPSLERRHQEALTKALGNANDDRSFVQPTPDSCPRPLFLATTIPGT
jgi:hypothetical protein